MFYPAAVRSFASDNTFRRGSRHGKIRVSRILPINSLLSVICFIKEQIHAPVSIILLDKSMDCFNKKLIDS